MLFLLCVKLIPLLLLVWAETSVSQNTSESAGGLTVTTTPAQLTFSVIGSAQSVRFICNVPSCPSELYTKNLFVTAALPLVEYAPPGSFCEVGASISLRVLPSPPVFTDSANIRMTNITAISGELDLRRLVNCYDAGGLGPVMFNIRLLADGREYNFDTQDTEPTLQLAPFSLYTGNITASNALGKTEKTIVINGFRTDPDDKRAPDNFIVQPYDYDSVILTITPFNPPINSIQYYEISICSTIRLNVTVIPTANNSKPFSNSTTGDNSTISNSSSALPVGDGGGEESGSVPASTMQSCLMERIPIGGVLTNTLIRPFPGLPSTDLDRTINLRSTPGKRIYSMYSENVTVRASVPSIPEKSDVFNSTSNSILFRLTPPEDLFGTLLQYSLSCESTLSQLFSANITYTTTDVNIRRIIFWSLDCLPTESRFTCKISAANKVGFSHPHIIESGKAYTNSGPLCDEQTTFVTSSEAPAPPTTPAASSGPLKIIIISTAVGFALVLLIIIVAVCCVKRRHEDSALAKLMESNGELGALITHERNSLLTADNMATADLMEENEPRVGAAKFKGGQSVGVRREPGQRRKPKMRISIPTDASPSDAEARPVARVTGAPRPAPRKSIEMADEACEDEPIYANTASVRRRSPTEIAVADLDDFLTEQDKFSEPFEEEFEKLIRNSKKFEMPMDVAQDPVNKRKNRYRQLYPFDNNRVVLPNGGYINASPIPGYNNETRYIASMGPNKHTVKDFWEMIYHQKVSAIAMVTGFYEKGKEKCSVYIPVGEEKSGVFGDFEVTLLSKTSHTGYTVRTLKATNLAQQGSRSHMLKHFHYDTWPDHGVPETAASLILMVKELRQSRGSSTGPILVHCSAGVGRTGTMMGLDFSMERAKAEKTVDIYQCILDFRRKRRNMIQTVDQYRFLYSAVLEATRILYDTNFSMDSFPSHYKELCRRTSMLGRSYRDTSPLDSEFKAIYASMRLKSANECSVALASANMSKNRDPDILPADEWRVECRPSDSADENYINAVYIDGWNVRDKYILTQAPLRETFFDFWSMVKMTRVCVIVMLNDTSQVCPAYWSDSGEFEVSDSSEDHEDSLYVNVLSTEELHGMTKRELRLSGSDGDECTVLHIQVHSNSGKECIPQNSVALSVIDEVFRYAASSDEFSRIVCHCRNGSICGWLIVAMNMIQRLEENSSVEVYFTSLMAKTRRSQMIRTCEEYKSLYSLAKRYIRRKTSEMEEEQIYANTAATMRDSDQEPLSP